jgi:hypothetical protein
MVSLPTLHSPRGAAVSSRRALGLPDMLRPGLSVRAGVEGLSRSDDGAEDPGAVGGDRSGFEFPDKPRGMRWRTYERWREKHEAAVSKSWSRFWGPRFASTAGRRLVRLRTETYRAG